MKTSNGEINATNVKLQTKINEGSTKLGLKGVPRGQIWTRGLEEIWAKQKGETWTRDLEIGNVQRCPVETITSLGGMNAKSAILRNLNQTIILGGE